MTHYNKANHVLVIDHNVIQSKKVQTDFLKLNFPVSSLVAQISMERALKTLKGHTSVGNIKLILLEL